MTALLAADSGGTSLVVWVVSLIISFIFAAWCAAIARRKGRSSLLWGILGFFFSIIALIVILVLPRTARAGG